MSEEYNSYNGQQNDPQRDPQNNGQNYGSGYSYSSDNFGQEPAGKKSGVGKIIAITLGMVLLVGVAALGGYSVNAIFDKLSGEDVVTEQPQETEKESQKISLSLPAVQETTSVGQSTTGTVILTDVSDVVERVMPTVVAITNSSYYTSGGFGFWDTMQIPTESSGSGIIIGQNDTELLIVTNNHVIEGNESLTVQFSDGSIAEASVKGSKATADIAIIAIPLETLTSETKNAIAIATIGDSDALRMGQGVIAIGNAMGYGQSVTTGCISALNRTVTTEDGTELTVLQTDAAINPGNSGGALLNQRGEVIGINTAKVISSDAEGIGYAIPIGSVVDLINDMMNWDTRQKVSAEEASYLGISPLAVDSHSAASYGMPIGVYAYEVVKDGPADRAGMLQKDIITAVDRYTIADTNDLQEALAYFRGGDTVTVVVQRLIDGKYQEITLEVTLAYKKDFSR